MRGESSPWDLHLTLVALGVLKRGAPRHKFGGIYRTLPGPLVVAGWNPRGNRRLDKEKEKKGDE